MGSDTYTWGIKDFHKCWLGSLAKRRLCLGPTGVINCTPASALSFWVSLFPGKHGYNNINKWKKKNLHDPYNHDGMITHLEPDILECKVKWAWGSITMNKAGGDDRIPVELFQILKDDAVKRLHSICQKIWKTQQWPQDWKRSVFIPIPKKGNAKECSKLPHNCTHLTR